MGRRIRIAVLAAGGAVFAALATGKPVNWPTSVPTPALAPTTGPATLPATIPATTPATVPATQPVDLSNPRAALRAFSAALHDGDADRLGQVVATTDPAEDRMLSAVADKAAALLRLHRAAAKAFGDAGADTFTGDSDDQYAQSLARIDAAEVTGGPDKATVRYPGAGEAEYELTNVGGRWRIPMAQFSRGADPATLDRRIAEARVQTQIMGELLREIDAGRYKNADAASEAWRGKVMQALGAKMPATGPATNPTTGPGA